MVTEILGARVVGPVFGVGLFVWSALISVTLGALALGYALGGKWIDRWPHEALLYGPLALAGAFAALIPVLRSSILLMAAPLGLRVGPVVAAVILFGPVLLVLGMVSPIAVRLRCWTAERAGNAAGAVYAISTVAGVVGALSTSHWLIPSYSVEAIWRGMALSLLVVAALGLLRARRSKGWLSLPLLGLLGTFVPEPNPGDQLVVIEATQSVHARLAVVDDTSRSDTLRLMRADHSIIGGEWLETKEPAFDFPYVVEALHLANPSGRRLLLLGLGAGTISALMDRYGVSSDVVEIDGEVLRLARDHFGFTPSGEVFIEDARTFVRRTNRTYDFIVQDTFTGGENPEHLFSLEMLQSLKSRLNASGLVVLNFVGSDDGSLSMAARAVNKTLRQVFEHVRVFRDGPSREDVPLNNLLYFASSVPIEFAGLGSEGFSSERQAHVLSTFQTWETLRSVDRGVPLITDDRNPLSSLTIAVSLRFHDLMNEVYPPRFWVN